MKVELLWSPSGWSTPGSVKNVYTLSLCTVERNQRAYKQYIRWKGKKGEGEGVGGG